MTETAAPGGDETVKSPDVAGMFYPGEPEPLAQQVDRYLAAAQPPALAPKAIIGPHAGYPFSGPTAAVAYRGLAGRQHGVRRVVIASPPHRYPVRGIALHPAMHWQTPLGRLAVDGPGWQAIAALPAAQTLPAAFNGEHGIEVHLPFIQRVFGDDVTIVPLLVGASRPEEVAPAFTAFWDDPETLIVISSDLSHFLEKSAAERLDSQTSAAIERLDGAALGENSACGRHAIKGLLAAGTPHFLHATTLGRANSADAGAPPDKVVGYGAYTLEPNASARLDATARDHLIATAREAVRRAAAQGHPDGVADALLQHAGAVHPSLAAHRASFVTLYRGGQLRACLGSTTAERSLLVDVAANAAAAATRDPRVPAVTPAEAEELEISVAILSPFAPTPAETRQELAATLTPGEDGVLLTAGNKRGLFLPQVWEGQDGVDSFLDKLLGKAGLPADRWPREVAAWRFRVAKVASWEAAAG